MGLEIAIDRLYHAGWSAMDSRGCGFAGDGRAYPLPDRVMRECADLGVDLSLTRVELFDCVRAEWVGGEEGPSGAAVAGSAEEAAVYALSRCLAARPVALKA
ncbi:MAG: hypothetical protein AAGG07_11875 [Planctomycetota bacterium]